MEVVNLQKAKEELGDLLDRVEEGEEILIARSGRPVAKLVRLPLVEPRRPGRLKGRLRIGPDFDDPLPEDLAADVRLLGL